MKQKSANDRQEGGDHYREKIQHWDAVKHWSTPDQYVGYLLCSASKYLARFNKKDGRAGVRKSIHYLEKLLEFLKEQDEASAAEEKCPSLQTLSGELGNFPTIPDSYNKIEDSPAPKSNEHYTYEGGTSTQDFYTCRTCRCYFIATIGTPPEYYHAHCSGALVGKVK